MRNSGPFAELAARLSDGDPTAWAELYTYVLNRVLPRCGLSRWIDTDEVACDTVAAVWATLARLRDDQKLIAVATTIARRVAARKIQSSRRYTELRSEPATPRDDAMQGNVEAEESLKAMLRPLSDSDRRLFRLIYVLGARSEQIEAELGISSGALWKRTHRLRKRLRGTLPRAK